MDLDKIILDLNRKFAEPLPEFYKRRIIVWKDEDREFEESISEIVLTDARVVVLDGTNSFAVKKLIAVDDTTSNILLYCPILYDDPEKNWLLDVELYSKTVRYDLISDWMDEMGIPQKPDLRQQVKAYHTFMKNKKRRDKITAMDNVPVSPHQLNMAIMAAIEGIQDPTPSRIIKEVMKAGLNIESNSVYAEFVNFGADKKFWELVCKVTGYAEEYPDLLNLASHIYLTAAARTISPNIFVGLQSFISVPYQNYCYGFLAEWMRSEDNDSLKFIAEQLEENLKIPMRLMKVSISDLVDTEIFPCVNEIILRKLMKDIVDNIIDTKLIAEVVEKRRTSAWYTEYSHFYDAIVQIANMQNFYKEHSAGFHTVEPQNIWKEYTDDYYIMDTYYRLFHKEYSQTLKSYNIDLHDLMNGVKDKAEGLYTNWFLCELGENWTDMCADNLRDYGYIQGIKRQELFYSSYVQQDTNKVYVVISDAFRYEVAATLTQQLRKETQCNISLSSMQAAFPTTTPFGMAALLPHKKLSLSVKNSRVVVLADGKSTESNNRENVLRFFNDKSVVLKYKNLITMSRAERKDAVRGMEVVYIYHDRIDNSSHSDETSVFTACDEAINDIKNVVRIITNDFGGTHIYITADHGFLCTHNPLKEDSKIDKTLDNSTVIEYSRRYCIAKQEASPEYLLPVKIPWGADGYYGFTSRENIRIKMSGSGQNYVHGGISLQEMVVPLIDYKFLRNSYKEYKNNKDKYDTEPVRIKLLSASRVISNLIFNLSFYQSDAVNDNREAATYNLYFIDCDGKKISDVQTIIADRTNENVQDRSFRVRFSLKSQTYSNTDIYYLVIEGDTSIDKEEFHIDNAFALGDWDLSD